MPNSLPDPDAAGDELFDAVRDYTERAVDPLRTRVESLERSVASLPSADFVRAEVAGATSKTTIDLLGALSKAPDGKTITVEDVRPLVETLVAAIPVPKDGAPGKNGRDGADGASVDPAEVRALVDAAVARDLASRSNESDAKAFADALIAKFMAAAVE